MLFFVTLLLGLTAFLGGGDTDSDADIGIETDADTDLAIETDVDTDIEVEVDVDADADIDVDVDTDADVELAGASSASTPILSHIHTDISPAHITGEVVGEAQTETFAHISDSEGKRKKRSLTTVLLAGSLGYLNAGKLPLSTVASALLALWGSIGLLTNGLLVMIFGMPLFYDPIIGKLLFAGVLGVSFVISLPLVRGTSKTLGNIFDTKSYHSSIEDYVGSTAKVVSHVIPTYHEVIDGKAIGVLDLIDQHGTRQKIYACIPDECKTIPKYKDQVILIDYIPERRLFKVLVEDSDDFIKWEK